MDTSKKRKGLDPRAIVLEFVYGGKAVSKSLLNRSVSRIGGQLNAQFKERSKLREEAAKYRKKIETPRKAIGASKETAQTAAALRAITDQVAKRKVIPPVLSRDVSGILAGTYSVTISPPYPYTFFESSIYRGSPSSAAWADDYTGQITLRTETDNSRASWATPTAGLGIFFSPNFPTGFLRARANLATTFSWWVNALPRCEAASNASFNFGIWVLTPEGLAVQLPDYHQVEVLWSSMVYDGLDFDFGSKAYPLSTQSKVDGGQTYLVLLLCTCDAHDTAGWPGSLAGANLAATLPSVTLEVEAFPVLSGAG
jgi:hypothetical protein